MFFPPFLPSCFIIRKDMIKELSCPGYMTIKWGVIVQEDRFVTARRMVFYLHLVFSHTKCCSRLEKKKTSVVISLPVSTTINNVTLQLFYQEIKSISPSLNISWPYDLLWPKGCGMSDTVPVLSLNLKR